MRGIHSKTEARCFQGKIELTCLLISSPTGETQRDESPPDTKPRDRQGAYTEVLTEPARNVEVADDQLLTEGSR